jgi:hypothetical protein
LLLLAGLVACLLLLGAGETPARAAFPGTNGKIAFSTLSDFADERDPRAVRGERRLGVSRPTTAGQADQPRPIGVHHEHVEILDRTGSAEIFVMNADGTNVTQVTNNPALDFDPASRPMARGSRSRAIATATGSCT